MINILIDSKELDQYLKELQTRTSDLSPVMRKISGYMLSAVEKNFEEEGRPEKFTELSKKQLNTEPKLTNGQGKYFNSPDSSPQPSHHLIQIKR